MQSFSASSSAIWLVIRFIVMLWAIGLAVYVFYRFVSVPNNSKSITVDYSYSSYFNYSYYLKKRELYNTRTDDNRNQTYCLESSNCGGSDTMVCINNQCVERDGESCVGYEGRCYTKNPCVLPLCYGGYCYSLFLPEKSVCGQFANTERKNSYCNKRGVCELRCKALWGNCDGNITTGCETDLNDVRTCGGCDNDCNMYVGLNSVEGVACVQGRCVITQCANGTVDCNSDIADGCECRRSANVQSIICMNNQCNYKCQSGYVTCSSSACDTLIPNGVPATCNNTCSSLYPLSVFHAYYTYACAEPIPLSDQQVIQTGSVVQCAGNNVSCMLYQCEPNYGDCDGSIGLHSVALSPGEQNGCETNLLGSTNNCGACGFTCDQRVELYKIQYGLTSSFMENVVFTCSLTTPCPSVCFFPSYELTDPILTHEICPSTCQAGSVTSYTNSPEKGYYGCIPHGCQEGFADCNVNLVSDGCETYLFNCPSCNSPCLARGQVTVDGASYQYGCNPNNQNECMLYQCSNGLMPSDNNVQQCINTSILFYTQDIFATQTQSLENRLLHEKKKGFEPYIHVADIPHVVCSSEYCELKCPLATADCNNNIMDGCECNITQDEENHIHQGGCVIHSKHLDSQCDIICEKGYLNCDHRIDNGCEVFTESLDKCVYSCKENGFVNCSSYLFSPELHIENIECKTISTNVVEYNDEVLLYRNPDALPYVSQCVITMCEQGYADCNGRVDDGCEEYVLNSSEHCGKCYSPCQSGTLIPQENRVQNGTCENGICLSECVQGFLDCDKNTTQCETYAPGCSSCEQSCTTRSPPKRSSSSKQKFTLPHVLQKFTKL